MTFQNATHPSLAPGTQLDAMNRIMLGLVAESLNRLKEETPKTVKLFEWVSRQITLATTNAAYGPANPYRDPKIEDAFW